MTAGDGRRDDLRTPIKRNAIQATNSSAATLAARHYRLMALCTALVSGLKIQVADTNRSGESMKSIAFACGLIVAIVPFKALSQDACSYGAFVEAIKALSAQMSSVTNAEDRYKYARCMLDEETRSTTSSGGGFTLSVPEVIELGDTDNGGTSSTTTRSSDCQAIQSSADYATASQSLGTNLTPGLVREARLAYEACKRSTQQGRPYCKVTINSPRVAVSVSYVTNPGEPEALIRSARARIIQQPRSTERDLELFSAGLKIPDKIPLTTNFAVNSSARVVFEIDSTKGPIACESVAMNQPVSVFGRVTPRVKQFYKTAARFGENAYHTHCNGFRTGRPIRGCVPDGAAITGHSFVDLPLRRTKWKIDPGSTSFGPDPKQPQRCFIARASIWEPVSTIRDLAECQRHRTNGTYYFVDVEYQTESMIDATTIDIVEAQPSFPLRINIPALPENSELIDLGFHFVLTDEDGTVRRISNDSSSSGPYSAVIPQGQRSIYIYRSAP